MQLSLSGKALETIVPECAARQFHLVRMNLTAAACPQPFSTRTANLAVSMPIVVIKNRNGHGSVIPGFSPKVIVAAGEDTRRRMMGRGVVRTWVWAEHGSLEINADDAISCEELSEKLNAALATRESPNTRMAQNYPGSSIAWILKIYPFENYFVYCINGNKFRQAYDLDPVARTVKLNGGPVKVEEKFVDARSINAVGMEGWPFPQTGMRPQPLASRPFALGISPAHPESEMITMIARDWKNINEAVAGYLTAIKGGLYKPMTPAFQPVKLTPDNKILIALTAAGIAPVDFVRYSSSDAGRKLRMWCREFSDEKRKKMAKEGTAMPDGSFPIANKSDLGNATKAFGRSADQATKKHIIKRAKALGATDKLPDKWNVKAAGKKCEKCGTMYIGAGKHCSACMKAMTGLDGDMPETGNAAQFKAAGVGKDRIQNHMHGLMRGSAYQHKKTNPDGTRVYAHGSNGRTLHIGTDGSFKVMNAKGIVLRKGIGARALRHHLDASKRKG